MSVASAWRCGVGRLLGRPAADEPADWGESLDRLSLALVRLDGEGRMRRLNTAWSTLTGWPVGESLGLALAAHLHPEDRPRWERLLQRLRSAVPVAPEVLRCLTRDGALRWVEARPALDRRGFVVALADVTEQTQGRRSLQASHRSLSSLLDDLPMMIYRCRNNRLWSMEYVSAGCFELTGYSAESLIDNREVCYNGLIHPGDRELVWAEVQAGLAAMRPFAIEYRLVRSDGSERRVQERGCGIYADGGEVLGIEGVVMAAQEAPPCARPAA